MPLHLRAGHPPPGHGQLLPLRTEDRRAGRRMQTTQNARLLVNDALKNDHYKALGNSRLRADHQRQLWGDLNPATMTSQITRPRCSARTTRRMPEQAAGRRLRARAARTIRQSRDPRTVASRRPGSSATSRSPIGSSPRSMWQDRATQERKAVPVHPGRPLRQAELPDGVSRARTTRNIDNHLSRPTARRARTGSSTKVGDLAGAVVITLPMDQTNNGDQQEPRHADHRRR